MAFSVNNTIATVEPQITGFGSSMGIELVIMAAATHTITTTATTTVELAWTDANGAHTVAQVLSAGTIDATTGLSIGVYYPGQVFADQAAAATFMGTITAKIFGATIS